MEENLKVYNELRAVPKEACKNFSNGRFSGTDINPMWRIKKLTETFGVCGIGWYWDEPKFAETTQGTTTTVHCTLALYIKDGDKWSAPIYGVGGNTIASNTKDGKFVVSDEAYKMAYTDAQSNAAKQLGLGADIWFEKDQTKYTKQQVEQPQQDLTQSKYYNIVNGCKTIEELQELWQEDVARQKDSEFTKLVTQKKKLLTKSA